MISYMNGIVLSLKTNFIILLVNDIGYEIELPQRISKDLVEKQKISLWLHEIIREDVDDLYGFMTLDDRDTFRLVLKAPQVGPKLALAILDSFSASQLALIALRNDLASLVLVKGLGAKLATRLMIDLKTWVDKGLLISTSVIDTVRPYEEATQALISLGYKAARVKQVLQELPQDSTKSLIKSALQILSRNT